MGKDSKPKDSRKGKGKQAAGGSDDGASKGKGKGGKSDGLGTCTYVKGLSFTLPHFHIFFNFQWLNALNHDLFVAPFLFLPARHILCEKQGKINEAYKKLQDGWLNNGEKVPPAEFAKVKLFTSRMCCMLSFIIVGETRIFAL